MDYSGDFVANWSINIDPLSSVMLVVVTFVSASSSHLFNWTCHTIFINQDLCHICHYLHFNVGFSSF